MKGKNKENMIENGELIAVKANKFVQEYKVSLSLAEIRIINYLIANIKSPKYDEEFREFEFDIAEFSKIIYPDSKQGQVYKRLKDTIKKLADKSAWKLVDNPDRPGKQMEVLVRWIEKPKILPQEGLVRLRLDEDLAPYLLKLDGAFVKSNFQYTALAQSKYTIPLYELLKSWEVVKKKKFELDELRSCMDAMDKSKDNISEFKRRALDPAVKEINEITDLQVSYEEIKRGRKTTHIEFLINRKVKEIQRNEKPKVKEMTPEEAANYDKMAENSTQPSLLDMPGFIPEEEIKEAPKEMPKKKIQYIYHDEILEKIKSEAFEDEFTIKDVKYLEHFGHKVANSQVPAEKSMLQDEVIRYAIDYYREKYLDMDRLCESTKKSSRVNYLAKILRDDLFEFEGFVRVKGERDKWKPTEKATKFSNFEERTYEMNELERALLEM